MNDDKKLLLQRLAEDEKTMEAIRTMLLEQVVAKPELSLNNEELGAQIRATEVAKQLVDNGLDEIKKYKIVARSEQKSKNPGK